MKVVALIALAFALANSATTDLVNPWEYRFRSSLFHGAKQTPLYMPNFKTQYDSNNLFFGEKMDLLESRQLNNYQDKRMMVSQQAMKELLLETEQLLEQTRFGNLDIDQVENLVSHLSEKMLQRLEEIEETLLQQAIQQVFEDRPNVLTAYESDIVKKMVTERAAMVLRKIAETITSYKMIEAENIEKESMKMTLQTVLAVQMLKQNVQQKESMSMIETTKFMNQVEQVLEQSIIDDIERAVAESDRKLKHIQRRIQLLNEQLQKVKLLETTNRQQTETIKVIEKVKQQMLQSLQEFKINEMAIRMANISLKKLLITQQYRMQQVSLQQVSNMDDMMMNGLTMRMMQ